MERRRLRWLPFLLITVLYSAAILYRYHLGETLLFGDPAGRAWQAWRWVSFPTWIPHTGFWLPGHIYARGVSYLFFGHLWFTTCGFTLLAGLGSAFLLYLLTLELFSGNRLAGALAAAFFCTHHWILSLCVAPYVDPFFYLVTLSAALGWVRWIRTGERGALILGVLFLVFDTTLRYEAWILISLVATVSTLWSLWGGVRRIRENLWLFFAVPPVLGAFPFFWLVRKLIESGEAFGIARAVADRNRSLNPETFWEALWAQPSELLTSSGILVVLCALGAILALRARDRWKHAPYLVTVLLFLLVFNSLRTIGVTNTSSWRLLLIHLVCLMPYAGSFLASFFTGVCAWTKLSHRILNFAAIPIGAALFGAVVWQSHQDLFPERWLDRPSMDMGRVLREAFRDPALEGLVLADRQKDESHFIVFALSEHPERFISADRYELGRAREATTAERAAIRWRLERKGEAGTNWVFGPIAHGTGEGEWVKLFTGQIVVESPPSRIELFARAMMRRPWTPGHAGNLALSVSSASKELALELLGPTLERFPDSAPLHHIAAACALDLGRIDLAGDYFDVAIELDPKDPSLLFHYGRYQLELENLQEALESLRTAARAQRPQRYDYWYWAGIAAQQSGDFISAEDFFSQAINLNPQDPQPRLRRDEVRKALDEKL